MRCSARAHLPVMLWSPNLIEGEASDGPSSRAIGPESTITWCFGPGEMAKPDSLRSWASLPRQLRRTACEAERLRMRCKCVSEFRRICVMR